MAGAGFDRKAREHGISAVTDFNKGDNEGVGPLHVTQKDGWRWSAKSAFLDPVMRRPNLDVITGALAERILLRVRARLVFRIVYKMRCEWRALAR